MAGGPPVEEEEEDKDKKIRALDAGDIALLKSYVRTTPLCHPVGFICSISAMPATGSRPVQQEDSGGRGESQEPQRQDQ